MIAASAVFLAPCPQPMCGASDSIVRSGWSVQMGDSINCLSREVDHMKSFFIWLSGICNSLVNPEGGLEVLPVANLDLSAGLCRACWKALDQWYSH